MASRKMPSRTMNGLFLYVDFHLKMCQWINIMSFIVYLGHTVALKQEHNRRLG